MSSFSGSISNEKEKFVPTKQEKNNSKLLFLEYFRFLFVTKRWKKKERGVTDRVWEREKERGIVGCLKEKRRVFKRGKGGVNSVIEKGFVKRRRERKKERRERKGEEK